MAKLGSLLQVGILASLGIIQVSTETPYITLFHGLNQTGYNVQLNSSIMELHPVDMYQKVRSLRYHGNFILYDMPGYNLGYPYARYVTKFYTEDHGVGEATDESLLQLASVRFIGSYVNGSHVPSMMLFAAQHFSATLEEVVTESKSVLDTAVISAILVGTSDWTFYDEINFQGKALCIKGASNYTGVRLFPLTYPAGSGESVILYRKRSVEVGCWERHGVLLEEP